jgi:hypothetical protein
MKPIIVLAVAVAEPVVLVQVEPVVLEKLFLVGYLCHLVKQAVAVALVVTLLVVPVVRVLVMVAMKTLLQQLQVLLILVLAVAAHIQHFLVLEMVVLVVPVGVLLDIQRI